jgi:hypothetical protein
MSMRKARILLVLGIWVTLIPYLGFPYSWKDVLTTLSGLVFIIFSYALYRDNKAKEGADKTFDNFRENSNFSAEENKGGDEVQNEIEIDIIEPGSASWEEPGEKSYREEI